MRQLQRPCAILVHCFCLRCFVVRICIRRMTVAVPRFEYELPPARRKGRFLWSVIIHAVAMVVLLNAAKWLPAARIAPRQSQVTLLYTPPPPVSTPVPPKITPPPP